MAEGPVALVPSSDILSLLLLPPVWAAIRGSRCEQTPYREVLRPTHSQRAWRATVGKLQPPPGEPSAEAKATAGTEPTLAHTSHPIDSPLPSVSTPNSFFKVNHE